MARNENHQVGLEETTLPTKDYDALVYAAKSQLSQIEHQLATDPIAKTDFRVSTALEVNRDQIRAALGMPAVPKPQQEQK